jgi:ubiquinone/menaquinone biosynthesis C-methylase UbiE
MISRVLEPEVMDTEDDARDYDSMDHSAVNRAFAADFLSRVPNPSGLLLDVGTGTAQIPIEFCRQHPTIRILAIDLAETMLKIGNENIARAGFTSRIQLERTNGRGMAYPDGHFAGVISNSIIHHIPEPRDCFAEMVRVTAPGGCLFVRDLLRPISNTELNLLVSVHAAGANDHQRQLFADSLHAALTLAEVQDLVCDFGFPPESVKQTSDRHWTWFAIKP